MTGAEGDQYALKILRGSVSSDPRIRERWRREAALLEELEHPNLVRSHGSLEIDGRPALLLEYIDGSTLRAAVADGPLGWEQVARYGVQVARALDRLHRHGAVHRDVKPHNVLLHRRRGAVLADLGLVRREEDPTLTRQGAALGSPAYMSPEQARDPSEVDAQADIYSLGATLHHALGGQPPFLGSGVGEVIHRVLHEEPEVLPDSVPEPLSRVLATAMAKDPERRYARARDLGADLGRVMLGYPPRLWTRHRRRRRERTAISAVAAVLVIALLGWWRPWIGAPGQLLEDTGPTVEVEGTTPNEGDAQGPTEVDPQPDIQTPPDAAEWFANWSLSYQERFRSALRRDRYREALAEIDAVRRLGIPSGSPPGFLEVRRVWAADAESQIVAAAERRAGLAMDILGDEARLVRAAVDRGLFDGATWAEEVRRLWRDAGLYVEDLPLHPGGPDPLGRLELVRATLDREAERARIQIAVAAVGEVRHATGLLLRGGHFETAHARWMDADSVVFEHSAEARSDLARIDELVAVERRLMARFRERVRTEVQLRLATGGQLSGELIPQDGGGYAIDYLGQREVPVDLLMLDADFVLEWLQGGEQPWLAAQLRWCQKETADALARMEMLAPASLPEEWNPGLWIAEWQRELQRDAEAGPPQGADGDDAAAARRADEQLLQELREALPSGTWSLHNDELHAEFQDVDWDPSWELDLRSALRGWRLAGWELRWELGFGETPPTRLAWLEDIELLRSGPRAVPEIRVGGIRYEGFGVQAGQGAQSLAWVDGVLLLDGVRIGRWTASGQRLVLRGEAQPAFRVSRLTLRLQRPR